MFSIWFGSECCGGRDFLVHPVVYDTEIEAFEAMMEITPEYYDFLYDDGIKLQLGGRLYRTNDMEYYKIIDLPMESYGHNVYYIHHEESIPLASGTGHESFEFVCDGVIFRVSRQFHLDIRSINIYVDNFWFKITYTNGLIDGSLQDVSELVAQNSPKAIQYYNKLKDYYSSSDGLFDVLHGLSKVNIGKLIK